MSIQKVNIDYEKTFEALKVLRTSYDMSLEEFSFKLGISIDRVQAWENNNELPDVIELCLLCNIFDTKPSNLIFTK